MQAVNTIEHGALDFLRVVWRRKWMVIASAAVAVAVAQYVTGNADRIYAGASRVVLAPSDSSVFSQAGGLVTDPLQMDTAVELIESRKIGETVRERLEIGESQIRDVSATAISGTRVVEIRVHALSPRIAADAATAYAEVFRDSRRDKAVNEALEFSKKLAVSLAQAKTELDNAEAAVAQAIDADQSDEEILRRRGERDAASANFIAIQQRIGQSNSEAAVRTGGVEVLDTGLASSRPVSPHPTQATAVALSFGLMVGIAMALGFDFLDDRVRSTSDIERVTDDVPALAQIPALADWRDAANTRLIVVEQPHSPASEAYRSLRTVVQLLEVTQDSPVIEITSSAPAEGKTTTVANLGVAFAMTGRKVTIVDCDLRRPRVHAFFGMENTKGLTSVLAGDVPLHRVIRRVELPNNCELRVLPAGFLAANPAELVGTARLASVIKTLKEESDIVLIDAPPVLPVTDAIVLASQADCVLLVASLQKTTRRQLSRALGALATADKRPNGIVVNCADAEAAYYYSYTAAPGTS